MSIYTVHAFRWGSRENHSYIVGVYNNPEIAIESALEEQESRGGKYECEIREWDEITEPRLGKVIWGEIEG